MINKVTVKFKGGKPSPEYLTKLAKSRALAAKKPGVPELMKSFKTTDAKYGLPVRYLGQFVFIGSADAVALDWNQLPYESQIHINQAIAAGHMTEVVKTAPAQESTQGGAGK